MQHFVIYMDFIQLTSCRSKYRYKVFDFFYFQMCRRILLWTTSPIPHAAVHLKGIFRRTLKGKAPFFAVKLILNRH
jgi:hypothetical protein